MAAKKLELDNRRGQSKRNAQRYQHWAAIKEAGEMLEGFNLDRFMQRFGEVLAKQDGCNGKIIVKEIDPAAAKKAASKKTERTA